MSYPTPSILEEFYTELTYPESMRAKLPYDVSDLLKKATMKMRDQRLINIQLFRDFERFTHENSQLKGRK